MMYKGMSLRILCFCSLFQLTSATTTTRLDISNAIGGSINLSSGTVKFDEEVVIAQGESLTVTSTSGGAVLDGQLTKALFNNQGTLTVNGITLQNGYGAIYGPGSLTVTDCTFSSNSANDWLDRWRGAAISSSGSIDATGCTFSSNSADLGGAIYIGPGGSLTVTECMFSSNSAEGLGGGAIASADTASLTVTDCTFSSNSGRRGADIYHEGDVSKYLFTGNPVADLYCEKDDNKECPAAVASNGDPHLQFADGGSADFRGSHNGIYNMLTSEGISVNALFREQDFYQSASGIEFARPGSKQGEKFLVHGTFIFEAYTTVRTSSGRLLHLHTEAGPFSSANVAFVENNVPVSQLDEHNERVVDNIKITTKDGVATIETPEWVVLCKIIRTDKSHFLNLSFKSLANAAAHGIIGQSYDHDGLAVDGAKDVYNSVPGGETTTTAQAEGAIEGHHSDYLMESPFATAYKYSLFNNKGAAVRDIRKLANTRVDRERRKLAFLLQRMAGKENVVGAE